MRGSRLRRRESPTHVAIGRLMGEAREMPAGNRRRPLEVRVRHEPCRIGEDVMVGAYEWVVAVVFRPLVAPTETSPTSTEQPRAGREGAA